MTVWTTACQAPLSMGFSRQEYWSEVPCYSPGDLPDPGIKLTSLVSPALAGRFLTTSATWEALYLSSVQSLSRVRLFVTAWTVASQAPLSMAFSRQEYWRGLPLPPPGDLPDPGIEPRSPALQADSLLSESSGKLCRSFLLCRISSVQFSHSVVFDSL